MKNKSLDVLIKFMFILILIDISKADNTTWFGNLRYRALQDKNTTEGAFSSISEMRSRLGFLMETENLSSSFILQESKTIGDETNFSGVTTRPSGPFLYEVNFKVKDLLGYDLIQFGRFELALGNQRIISKNNWNNVGRTFEGFLLTQKMFNTISLKGFSLGINENKNQYHDDSQDSWLNGIYLSSKIKQLKESYYEIYFIDFRDHVDTSSYATIGGRIDANFNHFNIESEYALQSGDHILSASLLSLNLGFKPKNFSFLDQIAVGFDYISGDNDETENLEGFSKYFGARHKFHGFYDYKDHKSFMNHDHDGLKELNIKTKLNFLFKSKLLISIHNFKSEANDTKYGNEIDFIIKRSLSNKLTLESGFIFYKPDRNDSVLPFSYFALTASFK